MKNMKKILMIMLIALVTTTSYGQYNKWAIEGDLGMHAVNDESATVLDQYNHLGLGVRYNINPKFGLGLTYGRDIMELSDFDGNHVKTSYNRFDVEAYVELFDILDLQNNYFTMLLHGGGGLGIIDNNENNYYQNVFNVRGGVTALFKVSKRFAIKLDASTTANIKQEKTLDGAYDISNVGTNSSLENITIGGVFYLGKKKDGKRLEHADWYVAPEPEYTIVNNVTKEGDVINKHYAITKVVKVEARVKPEYVFFSNDSYEVDKDGLNAIVKSANNLTDGAKIYVSGYASPPANNDYNETLSRNRAEAVVAKLRSIGVKDSQIVIEYNGEVDTVDSNNVDLSRRVRLLIK